MTQLLGEAGKNALVAAIKTIESRSSVEIVIAVRRSASTYRVADLACGVLVGLAALAFMLFSKYPFDTIALFVDPLLAGFTAALVSAYAPYLKLFFLSKRKRREAVRCAAMLAFMERGVHRTHGRTGVLVFLSLLEGMVELVLDTAVEAHMDEAERAMLRDALERALPKRGEAVAQTLLTLGDLLETRLPRLPDDVNELPDEVH